MLWKQWQSSGFKALVKYACAAPPPLLPHLHISFKRKSFVFKVIRSGRAQSRWVPRAASFVLSPRAALCDEGKGRNGDRKVFLLWDWGYASENKEEAAMLAVLKGEPAVH